MVQGLKFTTSPSRCPPPWPPPSPVRECDGVPDLHVGGKSLHDWKNLYTMGNAWGNYYTIGERILRDWGRILHDWEPLPFSSALPSAVSHVSAGSAGEASGFRVLHPVCFPGSCYVMKQRHRGTSLIRNRPLP